VLGWIALAGWGIVGGATLTLARMLREEARPDRIIGLLYHRVVLRDRYDTFTGAEQIFSVPEDRFAEQLEWLQSAGYSFISLDQLAAHLRDGAALPPLPVHITFDDGCESVYKHALPILEQLGIPSTVFVTLDENAWIFHEGEYFERRLSIEEIRACAAAGISIGSHAVTHRGLNEMRDDAVLHELTSSRETLSQWSGTDVVHFAVPLNFYNRRTLELCREAGYHTVCTSDNGTSNARTDPFKVKRFIVEGSYELAAFQRSLGPRMIVQRRILNTLKKLPPKLLGERIWMPLREWLFSSPLGRWLTFRHLRRALLTTAATAAAALVLITALALT
jgi:peptidoglycan/xylan/chitin deacetylase (PgdA/CDA1 family)